MTLEEEQQKARDRKLATELARIPPKKSTKKKEIEYFYPYLIEAVYTYKSAYKKYLHQEKVQRAFAKLDEALGIMEGF